jgi:hypothetical protein
VVNTVSEKTSPPSLQQTVNEFEKHIAQCMLKLREQHILPANVQQDVIAEMQLTVFQIHDAYQSIFLTFCEEQQILSESVSSGVSRFFTTSNSVFTNAFTNIDTDYKFNKFI